MPITPGTPLASGDLPAATADAQTNAAAVRTAIGAMENTAGAVLDKLKGATPETGRIGEEYMPELIPVDGVTLADTSSVELPANTLGINSSGRIVIHDGDTTGGVDADGIILRGAIYYTLTDNLATEKLLEIARVVIPSDAIVGAGVRVFLIGSAVINSVLSNYTPSGNVYLSFFFRDSAGNLNSTAELDDAAGRLTLATASAPDTYNILEFFEPLSMTSSGTLLNIGLSGVEGATRRRTLSGGVATETGVTMAGGGLAGEKNIPYGGTGGFCYLCVGIYLPPDSATADATGFISAACNLRLLIP